MTAKAHGLTDECEQILEASGLTEDQITMPSIGQPNVLPRPVVSTYKNNWPVKQASHSVFEKALMGEVEANVDESPPATNGFDEDLSADTSAKNGIAPDVDEEDAAGWDLGDDINVDAESDFVNVDSVEAATGSSEADLWARNSPIAADHVAGGSYESAMQLLNRQVGAVNFEPLKPRFMEVYQASKTYLPANAGLPPLVNYVRRTVDEIDPRKVLPFIPRDIESIASGDLQAGYNAMKANKLEDGVKLFKRVLHSILVNSASSQAEVEEAKKIVATAVQYALAMSIELQRRATATDQEEDIKRSLELSAYFTIPRMEVAHRQLALMAAMKHAFANKQLSSALSFANRMIANGGAPRMLDQVCQYYFEESSTLTSSNRRVRLKPSANGVPKTKLISSMTRSQNSTSAQHLSHRYTMAPQVCHVRMMEPNITRSIRVLSAEFARFVKSVRQRAGFGFLFQACHKVELGLDETSSCREFDVKSKAKSCLKNITRLHTETHTKLFRKSVQ